MIKEDSGIGSTLRNSIGVETNKSPLGAKISSKEIIEFGKIATLETTLPLERVGQPLGILLAKVLQTHKQRCYN
ncbi:hypothetical protein H6G83_33740 [Anabaena azotica FACHB-119]|uniref:Uncharacterized protein n=2 Tax=Anabaena azotica TaxID=197653 RepID=A0ABR8DE85_9NOST|nr:hypothetical protein [Anabaena azotica FACHB-119]